MMRNPALVAFAGPGYGFDDPNLGVILVNETQLWACLAAALMSIFLEPLAITPVLALLALAGALVAVGVQALGHRDVAAG